MDINNLIDMGFEKDRAELALKKASGIQAAIDWLEKNQDKSTDELLVEGAAKGGQADEDSALKPGEEARSLVCKECGRQLRSVGQAELHASKTGHSDFEESTEEIAPLTEEEKKAKLEELRSKLAAKRAGTSEQDKIDKKRNEEIRKKTTKETQDIKEDLAKKELLKDAAKKKKEKQDDILAKQKIKDKIAADKEERRIKAEREKAERAGQAAPAPNVSTVPTSLPSGTSKPASSYTETRLRLSTPSGNITKSFSVDSTLFEVSSIVKDDTGLEVTSFTQNYPKKTFDAIDFGATLKELNLVPSAALIVK